MKFLLSLALFAGAALADDLHLTNCGNLGASTTSSFWYNGQSQSCNIGSLIHWEAGANGASCQFSNGAVATAWLDPNAYNFDFQAPVGDAMYGSEFFHCYRDNGYAFYEIGGPGGTYACHTLYYCVTAE